MRQCTRVLLVIHVWLSYASLYGFWHQWHSDSARQWLKLLQLSKIFQVFRLPISCPNSPEIPSDSGDIRGLEGVFIRCFAWRVTDYCTKMSDGRYYDPWNPWCGYIVCRDEQAVRVVCRPGSWMGVNLADSRQLCRRHLDDEAVCDHFTDLRLCLQPAGLISAF